jgi:hypothetical protein
MTARLDGLQHDNQRKTGMTKQKSGHFGQCFSVIPGLTRNPQPQNLDSGSWI